MRPIYIAVVSATKRDRWAVHKFTLWAINCDYNDFTRDLKILEMKIKRLILTYYSMEFKDNYD